MTAQHIEEKDEIHATILSISDVLLKGTLQDDRIVFSFDNELYPTFEAAFQAYQQAVLKGEK